MPTVPFTATQVAQIRYYCGYAAFAAYGYVLSPDMATLDTQIANMSDAEQALVVSEFLNVLPGLKTAIDNTTANLDTDRAAVWVHNKNELQDRKRQYNDLRRRLCVFIGCAYGPDLMGGASVIRT